MKKIFMFVMVALFCSILAACDRDPPTSDEVQQDQQEQLLKQGTNAVGMPGIHNFQERKFLKMIFELRDQATTTYSYTQDMNGHFHKLCTSVGYGVSAATQFTSPQKAEWYTNRGYIILPQADPNGLFSPSSAEGTYVMCVNPKDKSLSVVYSEPRIVVSPFPLTDN